MWMGLTRFLCRQLFFLFIELKDDAGRRVLTERLLLVLHLLDLTSCICSTRVYEESRAVVEVQVECVGING